MTSRLIAVACIVTAPACADHGDATSTVQSSEKLANHSQFANDEGVAMDVSTSGAMDLSSTFFQSLGTNGRTCGSCHAADNGWAISADSVGDRFDATGGTDPIFRLNDGANSPNADVSTLDARRAAYSMLLSRGVIRVGRPIPAGAEFTLVAVDDPYHFASAAELSLFRRPLPSMDLRFITLVMWDGRETVDPNNIAFDLAHQANDATLGHAQATHSITTRQANDIVAFESPLYTAQYISNDAGQLNEDGAHGGPDFLSRVPFFVGITNPGHTFSLYDAWANLTGTDPVTEARRSVARGQAIFNTKRFRISGAAGIADQTGSCSTCHNTPNVGGHSSPMMVNIGIADGARRTPDMPLYTLRNNATGETVTTTDPGLALSTGKWADIGRFKVPNLRGIETRSPYFHSGFKSSIEDLVDFYNGRFAIGLTTAEKADLAAFIKTL